MKLFICSLFGLFFGLGEGSAQIDGTSDSLIHLLDRSIEMRKDLHTIKDEKIRTLKNKLIGVDEFDLELKEKYLLQLYHEYRSFNYDSAFSYSASLLTNAYRMQKIEKIESARMKTSFILLSSGLFKESLDTLNVIAIANLSDNLKKEYYHLKARIYFDMADYTGEGFFAPKYNIYGNILLDSAILLCPKNSVEYMSFLGLKLLRQGNIKEARTVYEKLIQMPEIERQQFAIEASSLSFIYKFNGEPEKSLQLLIKAAIADIETSTKETVAIRQLAEILYNKEDFNRAYEYIKIALEDANFYGARHRKVQVSDILPRIEQRQLEIVKAQRRAFLIYSVSASFFSILIIIFIIIIFKQLKAIKKARTYLSEANIRLTEINLKLKEANKIKEEYIGHFFDTISDYINRFERFKLNIGRKITTHQVEDIKDIISSIDIKKEREGFYHNFDHVFLRIFPGFVDSFNSFLKEDHLGKNPDQLLTPEVRIYALIRLGINDNEKIARFLGYSLNTIYAYKTKIKNKLNLSYDDFEKQFMKIEAV